MDQHSFQIEEACVCTCNCSWMLVNLTCRILVWIGVSCHEHVSQGQIESCKLSENSVRKRKREFAATWTCATPAEKCLSRARSLSAPCSSVENRSGSTWICKQWHMSHRIKDSWKDTQFVVLLPFSLPAALSSLLASCLLRKTAAEMEKWDGWQHASCLGIKRRLSLWRTPCRPSPGVIHFFRHSCLL